MSDLITFRREGEPIAGLRLFFYERLAVMAHDEDEAISLLFSVNGKPWIRTIKAMNRRGGYITGANIATGCITTTKLAMPNRNARECAYCKFEAALPAVPPRTRSPGPPGALGVYAGCTQGRRPAAVCGWQCTHNSADESTAERGTVPMWREGAVSTAQDAINPAGPACLDGALQPDPARYSGRDTLHPAGAVRSGLNGGVSLTVIDQD